MMKSIKDKFASELASWCEDKLKSYSYTGKKGLPRKSEKPFTPKKFNAALIALFSQRVMPLAEAAKLCDIKYSVLKVWRSEERFKDQVKNNTEEYSKHFVEIYLREANPERLENDFSHYDIYLQYEIMKNLCRMLRDVHCIEEFLRILVLAHELFNITLDKLDGEEPIKRSTLKQINRLENLQMMTLNHGRQTLYEYLKELLSQRKKDKEVIRETLDALDFMDEAILGTLGGRMRF